MSDKDELLARVLDCLERSPDTLEERWTEIELSNMANPDIPPTGYPLTRIPVHVRRGMGETFFALLGELYDLRVKP